MILWQMLGPELLYNCVRVYCVTSSSDRSIVRRFWSVSSLTRAINIRKLCRMPKLFHFKEVRVRVLFLVFWRNMGLLLALFSLCFLSPLESQHPPGHLQPLGSHQPPSGSIESSEVVPGPREFFDENVRPGKPLLLRGAAKSMPAFSNWTDGYLRWDK